MKNNKMITEAGKRVLGVLRYGLANAISIDELAKQTQIPKRRIFTILNSLKSHGFLVGSSRSGNKRGVYLIDNKEEYWHAVNMLKANARSYTEAVNGLLKHEERFK